MLQLQLITLIVLTIIIIRYTNLHILAIYPRSDPLPDIVHSNLSVPDHKHITDVLLILPAIYIAVSNQRFNQFFPVFLVILIVRAIMNSVTVLQSSKPSAKNDNTSTYFGLQTHHNQIFSGHMAFIVLASMIYFNSNSNKSVYISSAVILYNIFSGIVIAASKNHYTVDVLVSPFVVYTILKLIQKIS